MTRISMKFFSRIEAGTLNLKRQIFLKNNISILHKKFLYFSLKIIDIFKPDHGSVFNHMEFLIVFLKHYNFFHIRFSMVQLISQLYVFECVVIHKFDRCSLTSWLIPLFIMSFLVDNLIQNKNVHLCQSSKIYSLQVIVVWMNYYR